MAWNKENLKVEYYTFGVINNMEKKPQPIQKKEKTDTSLFKGRPHFRQEEYKRWLKSSESWKATGLSKEKREKLGEKLLSQKRVGQLIQRGEPERVLHELERGKIRGLTYTERKEGIRLLKKALGK